jgi:hypothetical protein
MRLVVRVTTRTGVVTRVSLLLDPLIHHLTHVIAGDVDTEVEFLVELLVTVTERARKSCDLIGLRGMPCLHVVIQGVFLVEALVALRTLMGHCTLMLLQMVVHCILALLDLAANPADIVPSLILLILEDHPGVSVWLRLFAAVQTSIFVARWASAG